MDQPLYDIYFTGQLVEGADAETGKANLAALFKASPEKVDRFFDGKAHLLKRGVDKQAALKYKAALHKAGLLVSFKAHLSASQTHQVQQDQTEKSQQAAISPSSPSPSIEKTPIEEKAEHTPEYSMTLAAAGSDVLKDDERSVVEPVDIDTSDIKLVSAFMDVEPELSPAPPAPDTSHISVAATGEDLLVDKPEAPQSVDVDIDNISLAPAGSDLEQLSEEIVPIEPDLNDYSIAEAGADLLEGRAKEPIPPAPNTDHISVADD